MTDTPKWALDEAANRAGFDSWAHAKSCTENAKFISRSIRDHAATLAKYETKPTDPWLLQAREIAAEHAERDSLGGMARDILAGTLDDCWYVSAVLFALKSDWKPNE